MHKKMPVNTENATATSRNLSILEQLEQLDETNRMAFKDQYDESVLEFVEQWQKLVDDYGYQQVMKVDIFKADHPYPEPVFPIKIMEQEAYMTEHYASVAGWRTMQKRPTVLHVIELREEKVIGAINIVGPLNEYSLFQAFVDICIYTKTLSVVRLVGCSLRKEGVMLLGKGLSRTTVTHLYLDRNPIADEDFSFILENNTTLVHLSLAMCKIGFKGTRALSRVLGPYEGFEPNQHLKSLVLDDNNIDSLSMKVFAECLRWNTDLVFLSLAGNLIGDQGLVYLSSSFYATEMSQKEINLMNCRQIERLKELEDIVNEELHLPVVEIQNQEVDLYEEEDGGLPNLFDEDRDEAEIDPIRMRLLQQTCDEFLEMDPNPLVSNVTLCNGKLIGGGNYTLNVLNISYNKIRERGFMSLLEALREQHLARTSRDQTERAYNLRIIEYMGNPCPENYFVLRKIEYYLKQSNKELSPSEVPNEPCSCIPVVKSTLDPETLLLHDELVDYLKPTSEDSEEMEEIAPEWECCGEFTEIEYEPLSDKKTEENENEEEYKGLESIKDKEESLEEEEEETSEECEDITTSEEETEEQKQIII